METIMYINALLFFLGICCLVRYAYLRCSDDETEEELERDKKSADKLAVTISKQSAGLEDCREKTERIEQNQSGIAERIIDATESINEARERSENTVELIDECLEILSEAEKKSRKG